MRNPTDTCNDIVHGIIRKSMSPESIGHSATNDVVELNLKETELTLGLPGDGGDPHGIKTGRKRGFSETIDHNLGGSPSSGSSCQQVCEKPEDQSPASKSQVVGWPPVRGNRKSVVRNCKYVKVAVDGAPYLRKVDLQVYESYEQLLRALEIMFSCFTIRNHLKERKLMEAGNGVEYVLTYEDKDGDCMLVGDVPWKMFVESCRRVRLMISTEAIGIAPRTDSKLRPSS